MLFYILEYWKLDFRNPAFISFWLLESIAYLVLSYSASLNLGLYVCHLPHCTVLTAPRH